MGEAKTLHHLAARVRERVRESEREGGIEKRAPQGERAITRALDSARSRARCSHPHSLHMRASLVSSFLA